MCIYTHISFFLQSADSWCWNAYHRRPSCERSVSLVALFHPLQNREKTKNTHGRRTTGLPLRTCWRHISLLPFAVLPTCDCVSFTHEHTPHTDSTQSGRRNTTTTTTTHHDHQINGKLQSLISSSFKKRRYLRNNCVITTINAVHQSRISIQRIILPLCSQNKRRAKQKLGRCFSFLALASLHRKEIVWWRGSTKIKAWGGGGEGECKLDSAGWETEKRVVPKMMIGFGLCFQKEKKKKWGKEFHRPFIVAWFFLLVSDGFLNFLLMFFCFKRQLWWKLTFACVIAWCIVSK